MTENIKRLVPRDDAVAVDPLVDHSVCDCSYPQLSHGASTWCSSYWWRTRPKFIVGFSAWASGGVDVAPNPHGYPKTMEYEVIPANLRLGSTEKVRYLGDDMDPAVWSQTVVLRWRAFRYTPSWERCGHGCKSIEYDVSKATTESLRHGPRRLESPRTNPRG